MRVALDARHAARGLGIANFIANLARELVKVDELELVWLGDPALAPDGVYRSLRFDRLPYPALDGPLGRRLLARAGGLDVVHFTGNTGWGRPGPIASVLTLQDLIFMTTATRARSARQIAGHWYERRLIGRAVHDADVLAVSSLTIAAQVRELLGPALEPRVVPYGVSRPPEAAAPAGAATPYLVAFAGRDPRKRTADVIAAWRALAEERGEGGAIGVDLTLLASAGLPAGLRESIAPEIAAGRVRVCEHLPRAQLWSELAGALALIYPSSDEGFGLPVLEGMAAGTPVLSGLAPATREVGGHAIVALDPADVPGSIASAVRRLLEDPAHAAAVTANGLAHAARFSWRATAEGYLELYRAAVERHRARSRAAP